MVASSPTTTVSGDGSQATPYMVDVSCETIQDCVGGALGCGLQYDDAGNEIAVQLSAQPGNTIQCLPDGLFSAPGAFATGCGLTTDGGGDIAVNALDFSSLTRRNCGDLQDDPGTTPLDPACELNGMAVYCDTNGNLRVRPEKFTDLGTSSINEAIVPTQTVLPFTTSAIQLSITNPSDCDCICGMLYFAFIPAITGAPGTVIRMDHMRDMGAGLGFQATTGYHMDNRGRTANASGPTQRHVLPINVCLDPGETKIIQHQVRFTRDPINDNGGAISITAVAREIYWIGTNL